MEISELKSNIEKLQGELASIKENRKKWLSNTKPLILDILNKIKKAFDLKWTIYEANDILNYEGIIFSLGTKPSGLTQMTVKGRKKLLKNGGNLIFSQTYNGQILIIIKYPSVEDFIVSSEPIKQIIKVNPNEISEDFIVRQVDNFLTEMINWEKSVSSKPIGFNQKN